MQLEQIKAAVAAGLTVYWKNSAYQVLRDSGSSSGYSIVYNLNGRGENRVGLTWQDGVRVNGDLEDFHVSPSDIHWAVDDARHEFDPKVSLYQQHVRYVGFDNAGSPPRIGRKSWVAVWSCLRQEIDVGEATELAIDFMVEYGHIPESNPHASIVI